MKQVAEKAPAVIPSEATVPAFPRIRKKADSSGKHRPRNDTFAVFPQAVKARFFCIGCATSRSRFNSRTFTRGSPRKPSWRPSVVFVDRMDVRFAHLAFAGDAQNENAAASGRCEDQVPSRKW